MKVILMFGDNVRFETARKVWRQTYKSCRQTQAEGRTFECKTGEILPTPWREEFQPQHRRVLLANRIKYIELHFIDVPHLCKFCSFHSCRGQGQ